MGIGAVDFRTFYFKGKHIALYSILFLGLLLRLILSIVNKDWTDDHVTPVLLWLEYGGPSGALGCWECFQPPLFYWIVKTLSQIFHLESFDEVLNVIRTVNFILSSATMLIVAQFIQKLEIRESLKRAVLVFWVLNPELISVGALNTNDTLLIFLGLLAYLLFQSYHRQPKIASEILIGLMLFLLGITKGNGLVFIAGFGMLVFILLINRRRSYKDMLRLFAVLSTTVWMIYQTGGYQRKYETRGDAFMTNLPKQAFPPLIHADTTYKGRLGVTSIAETYFSFRLLSLLEEPFNSNGYTDYPMHRTSMLSQFYGQFNNYFFEFHPPSWQCSNNDMKNFVRANYLVQLPLLFIFLLEIVLSFVGMFKRKLNFKDFNVLFLMLFVLFTVQYSLMYRDFSTMKLLFIFPALLPVISIFSDAVNRFKWRQVVIFLLYSTSALYLVNYAYLIRNLVSS